MLCSAVGEFCENFQDFDKSTIRMRRLGPTGFREQVWAEGLRVDPVQSCGSIDEYEVAEAQF